MITLVSLLMIYILEETHHNAFGVNLLHIIYGIIQLLNN
jgi:hypothetical protein